MFSESVHALLAGKIICPVTMPRAYEYLSREQNLEDMNAYFARMERAIVSPDTGGSFFLIYSQGGSDEITRLRELHSKMLGEVDPLVRFVELMLRATGAENMLQAGEDIHLNQVVSIISQNETLRIDLQDLATNIGAGRNNDNDYSRLSAVLTKLHRWDYLKQVDADRQIFRVTGKIDLYRSLVDFLIENLPGAKEEVDAYVAQGTML